MSHQGGHGDVTLPADYVRDHVRLGYAATEHGWQSDTVHTAIALTSPATTRRGLYVAATRGCDTNLLCVITASDDIAEARDILVGILAIDRADVPATTQRHTLADTTRHADPVTELTPRCRIPDWFPTLLHDAQQALAAAETRQLERAAQRRVATEAAARADKALANIAAATAPDRDALHHAEQRADRARHQLAATQRRLDTAPRRQRRVLRNELATAQQQLDCADDYRASTRQRTAPAIEQHTRAATNARETRDRLRDCDTIDRLHTRQPTVGEHRQHILGP